MRSVALGIELTDIAAIVDLFYVVQIPQRQRIVFLDLRVAFDREREDVLNRFEGRIGRAFE